MKRVLITGASSGIGRQLAIDYAADGWFVLACGRSTSKLASINQTNIETICFDTAQKVSVLTACNSLEKLDLVILNAGTCEYIDDVIHFDSDLFERVIQTNLIGTAYCLEALIDKIKPGGQLALMSSSATRLPFSRAQAYGASKAGIDYLAESLAVDLKPHRIDVSLIHPCFVDTPLTRQNNFAMPGQINVQQASQYIQKGLAKRKAMIAFTPLFIAMLNILKLMPRGLWQSLQHRNKK